VRACTSSASSPTCRLLIEGSCTVFVGGTHGCDLHSQGDTCTPLLQSSFNVRLIYPFIQPEVL
jgi:hypothetical protein